MSDIANIPLKRIRRALRLSTGNLSQAARKLKVNRVDLRAYIDANPELVEAALEAEERAIDKAEASLRAALRDPDPLKRLAAAAHIVRTRRLWRNP